MFVMVWIHLCHSCLSERKISTDALDSKKVCVFSLHSHKDSEDKRKNIPALTEACRCGISIPERQLSYSEFMMNSVHPNHMKNI